MAASVEAVDGAITGGTTVDVTFTVTDASLLVAFACSGREGGNEDQVSVVWDPSGENESFTKHDEQATSQDTRAALWSLRNPTPGSALPIRFTISNTENLSLSVVSVINGGSLVAGSIVKKGGGAAASDSINVTGTTGGISVGLGLEHLGNSFPSHTSGFTLIHQANKGGAGLADFGIDSRYVLGSGTHNFAWDDFDNGRALIGGTFDTLAGGNRAFMIFSEAWDRWRDRTGLLVPKGFNEPIWKPKPQILTPSGAQVPAPATMRRAA